MSQESGFIINRHNLRISYLIDLPDNPANTWAVMLHGHGGRKMSKDKEFYVVMGESHEFRKEDTLNKIAEVINARLLY